MTQLIEPGTSLGAVFPLDPLTAEEMTSATGVLKKGQAPANTFGRVGSRHRTCRSRRTPPRNGIQPGRTPTSPAGSDGVLGYAAKEPSIVDTDLVVWYRLGKHHVVHLEGSPVMPRLHVGYILQPFGYFDQSLAMESPQPLAAHGSDGHVCSKEGERR